jgi:hypothetical protein
MKQNKILTIYIYIYIYIIPRIWGDSICASKEDKYLRTMTDANLITNNGNQATKGWGIIHICPLTPRVIGIEDTV